MFTDYGIKYIYCTINDRNILLEFRISLLKGIHNIRVLEDGKPAQIEIEQAYPPLGKVLQNFFYFDLRLYRFFSQIKETVTKFLHRHNQ